MSSRTSFDNRGQAYDVSQIINPYSSLNLSKYEQYSPLFLSTTFAISYGLSFASITGKLPCIDQTQAGTHPMCRITATITHTILFFRKQIYVQARRALSEQPDIHARLMSRYKQVPEWWYSIIFCTH